MNNKFDWFDDEFASTNEHELEEDFIELVTCWDDKEISHFEKIENNDGTVNLVVYLRDDIVADEFVEIRLIKTLSKLMKDGYDVVDVDLTDVDDATEKVVWAFKKLEDKFSLDSVFSSYTVEAEIVTLKSLTDYYLDRLNQAQTEQEKVQIEQVLADIVGQLKQLEYF